MSNLYTYEMQMFYGEKPPRKEKSIAFVAEEQGFGSDFEDTEEDTIKLLTENFSKILKQINKRTQL